jgi:hypothetical protein
LNKLVITVVGLVVSVAAGPTIVAVIQAAIPLVTVAGLIGMIARVVWFYTR